jgi:hypothetical protein
MSSAATIRKRPSISTTGVRPRREYRAIRSSDHKTGSIGFAWVGLYCSLGFSSPTAGPNVLIGLVVAEPAHRARPSHWGRSTPSATSPFQVTGAKSLTRHDPVAYRWATHPMVTCKYLIL